MSRGEKGKTFLIFLTIRQAEGFGFLDRGFGFVSISAPGDLVAQFRRLLEPGLKFSSAHRYGVVGHVLSGLKRGLMLASHHMEKARGIPWLSNFCPAASELYPFIFFLLRAHSNDLASRFIKILYMSIDKSSNIR